MASAGRKFSSISWVVAAGLAAWAAARITGADRVRRTETTAVPLMSFTPQVAAVAPWAALGMYLTRRRGPAVLAGLAAAALGLVMRSREIPRPQPDASGPTLRVLSSNLFAGRADPAAIVALVRDLEADVLFAPELTAGEVTRLKQAGLDELLPHTQFERMGGNPRGSGIYSRFPLGEGPVLAPVNAGQPTALLELPGGQPVELICAHPSAPAPKRDGAIQWREELAVLLPPGDRPRVVAGDFNATLDHARFRDLLDRGYADAALQVGNARTATWGPLGKFALFTLDHVLVSRDCAVRASSVHRVPQSDHWAVYARIQLP
jgi:endonuclease/exonuclease/phosphatase (EEP) superfamily protein YafD